ncbi:unnamed protein product [Trichogramma brassicae]|uniref:Uncharacterized protein n=1 Tax=Trichogramma brassicae TaxID=86971 RepID=A0A6H5IA56_9HYME|nr:unnamed protein product [Trichogramma brassicae]
MHASLCARSLPILYTSALCTNTRARTRAILRERPVQVQTRIRTYACRVNRATVVPFFYIHFYDTEQLVDHCSDSLEIAFILFSTNLEVKKVRKGGSRLGECTTAYNASRASLRANETKNVRKVRHGGASSVAACGIGVESRVLLNTSKKYFSSLPSPMSGGLLHTLLLYRGEI